MPQLASRQRGMVDTFRSGFLRWLSAVFPKGLLARAHGRTMQVGRSLPGHVLRAPGEDGVILLAASLSLLDYRELPDLSQLERTARHLDHGARQGGSPLSTAFRAARHARGAWLCRAAGAPVALGEASCLVAAPSPHDLDVTPMGVPPLDAARRDYLGAKAHFMVLSSDGEDHVHVHALDDAGSASRLSAHAVFPRPGLC